MAVYGIDYYAGARFGVDPNLVRPDFSVAPFASMPLDYARLRLTWVRPPSSACTQLQLVRDGYNLPQDETDGTILFTQSTAAPTTWVDDSAGIGFNYYSMFGWDSVNNLWVRCTDLIAMLPLPWNYGFMLYDRLPGCYHERDVVLVDPYNPWSYANPSNDTPPLQRYLNLLGFQLDFVRTELESMLSINDARNVSGALLPLLGYNFAIPHEPEIGMQQERQLVGNAIHLYKLKGSSRGITEFASILTSYPTALVHKGYNLLLTRDDSVMATSIGTWQTWPPQYSNLVAQPGTNVGVTLTQVPNLLQVAGMTNPLEFYAAEWPEILPPYANTGMKVTSGGAGPGLTPQNSSFEGIGTGDWVAGNATTVLSNTTAAAVAGTHSLQLHNNPPGGNLVVVLTNQTIDQLPIEVDPGNTYTFSAAFRPATTARVCTVTLAWLDSTGAQISTLVSSGTDAVGAWTTVSAGGAAPANAATARLTVTIAGPGINENHYVDLIQFAEAATDVLITTGQIPVLDFLSSIDGPGNATFIVQFFTGNFQIDVDIGLYGDNGSGHAIQIGTPVSGTTTFGDWSQFTFTAPIVFNQANDTTQAEQYYWVYPVIRLNGLPPGDAVYITLVQLWACTPDDVGVYTPVYDYPRNLQVMLEPQMSNLLANPLTDFPNGLDGWSTTTNPLTYNLLSPDQSVFQTSLANWQASNLATTIIRSTAQAKVGSASMQMTYASAHLTQWFPIFPLTLAPTTPPPALPLAAAIPPASINLLSPNQVDAAGTVYPVSGWFLAGSAGRPTEIDINWWDKNSNSLGKSTVTGTDVTGSFTETQGNVVAPTGAVFMSVGLNITGVIDGESHYVDDLVVGGVEVTGLLSIRTGEAIYGSESMEVVAGNGPVTVFGGTVLALGERPTILGWWVDALGLWYGPEYFGGILPTLWFDPVIGWNFIQGSYFSGEQGWNGGDWFEQPPVQNTNNLAPFNCAPAQVFNFSVYLKALLVNAPSDASAQLGLRWYFPDTTFTETVTDPIALTSTLTRYDVTGQVPFEDVTGIPASQFFVFVRFPVTLPGDSFLMNGAMLCATGDMPPFMDSTLHPGDPDYIIVNGGSYYYRRRTPRTARLRADIYRWIPMGATYSQAFGAGEIQPPLDPTLWP